MDETWTKRGEFGFWTSPSGGRYWLFPSDYPLDIDGVSLVVRVVEPALVSMAEMLGLEPATKTIWVSVVAEPGPFRLVDTIAGGEGLDGRVEKEVRGWWEKRGMRLLRNEPCDG